MISSAHRLDPRPVQALLDAPTLALTPRGGLLGGAALARLRGDGRGIDRARRVAGGRLP